MTSGVLINEIGADLGFPLAGDFIELHNAGSSIVNVGNYRLTGCSTTSSFTIGTIDAGTQLDSGESYLFVDDDYFSGGGPLPNKKFAVGVDLVQAGGGVMLRDSNLTVVGDVKWGTPHANCSFFIDAGVTPDDNHSIQTNPTPPLAWCKAIPTPGASNGPCVF